MKVVVWASKEEVINGNISTLFPHCPQPQYNNYIQVNMSIDEYVKIQDNIPTNKSYKLTN